MGGGASEPHNCPKCAHPLRYIVKYDAWYCKECKGYRDLEVARDKVANKASVPPVIPRSSTPVQERCSICLGIITDESEHFECECGNLSHDSCSKGVGRCSGCGKEHTKKDPSNNNDFLELMEKGRTAFTKNQYDEALKWYDEALKLKEKSAIAWSYKGTILAHLGRHDMALECYDNSLEIRKSPVTWYNKAVTLFNMDMLRETLNCIIDAIEMESDDGWFWYIKGCALFKMGRNEESVECFDRALSLIPDSPLIWFGKGAVLVNSDQLDGAMKCYEKALRMDPENVDVLYAKAKVLLAEMKIDEAISAFDAVLSKNPDHRGAMRDRERAVSHGSR